MYIHYHDEAAMVKILGTIFKELNDLIDTENSGVDPEKFFKD